MHTQHCDIVDDTARGRDDAQTPLAGHTGRAPPCAVAFSGGPRNDVTNDRLTVRRQLDFEREAYLRHGGT